MERLGQKFIFRMFAEYYETFYSKRVPIIYRDSTEEVISKKELKNELRKFLKALFSTDYKKNRPHCGELLRGLEIAIDRAKYKNIAASFAVMIMWNRGVDYVAPIPKDDEEWEEWKLYIATHP